MKVAALLVSLLFLANPAKPPSPEEQRLFDEGMRALQAGKPDDAQRAWKAGYQVGKDPAFLIHIGEAAEKAGALPDAVESYRRYLREAPDAADRAEIEQRLTRLGANVAPATTPATAASPTSPAGEEETPGAFGDGAGPTSSPSSPTAPPPGEAATPPAAPATPHPASDGETGRMPDGPPSGWNARNITAWLSVAAAATLLGVAGFYAASAGSKKDDVDQLLRYRDQQTGAPLEYQSVAGQYQDATAAGQHDDRVAKGALVAAAVAGGIATVFFILDGLHAPEGQPASKVALGLAVAPDGGRAAAFSSLLWRF